MELTNLAGKGLGLLGCGKMGSAMLQGWLSEGLAPSDVWVIDPAPSAWLRETGVHINEGFPDHLGALLIAVKPQMMDSALPAIQALGTDTLFLSVAAGVRVQAYETALGESARIVRIMPNTPSAVGKGISALIGNAHATPADLALARALMQSVGQVVELTDEDEMDAVTAVSGSGPAYVFHLIETLAAAGEAQGLTPETAMQLARATVAGAGALAEAAEEGPDQLRINVTSPGGTTAAALEVLMDKETGFPALLQRAVKAAADRSKELGA